MSLITAHVRVLNSLLFIKDAWTRDLPKIDGHGSFWATASCVAVSCMPDCDGPTEVTIEYPLQSKNIVGKLLFDETLETSSRSIVVETVLADKILEQGVLGATTRVQIWTDGFRDTNKIKIGLE
ncbi:MAG TPA: hypothetical protein VLK33_23165 [Terriglobales bacterium]|nr:hypothetical protein [Terriglobales bacterium]